MKALPIALPRSILLLLPLATLAGCKPPLRITYDIVGTSTELLTSTPRCRVAMLNGPGDWSVTVESAVTLADGNAGNTGPTRKRDYRPLEEKVEVFLEDFLPENKSQADGRYTFHSVIEGGNDPHILPPSTVVLDRTPPEILRILPGDAGARERLADGSEVFLTEGKLLISVEDRSTAELLVDGSKVSPNERGFFEVRLISPHTPEYQLEAIDAAGNRTSLRIQARFDRREPVIRWPESIQKVVYQADAALEFAVEDDTAVDLVVCKLNGKEIPIKPLADGGNQAKLSLDTGKNHLIVEARDKAGRRTVGDQWIEYDPSRIELKAKLTGSTDAPAYTAEAKCRVAQLGGLADRQVTAAITFQPATEGKPQETRRHFKAAGGELEVFLDELAVGSGGLEDGLYKFSFSVDGVQASGNPAGGAVILDRKKPALLLLAGGGEKRIEAPTEDPSPADPLEVVVRGEDVAARLMDASPSRLWIDDQLVEPRSDGSFKLPVRPSALKLAAADAAGNRSTWELRLLPDREEPVLHWLDLPPGGLVDSPELRLECRVKDDSGVEKVAVKLNGEPTGHEALDAGLIGIPLHLKPGSNELAVSIKDLSGRETASFVTLTLQEAPSREYPALVEEGGKTLFLIEDDRGQPRKWALPLAVLRVEAVEGKKGIFNVTTPVERARPMALVPGGAFPVGTGPGRLETLTPFLMDVFEVTVERFETFQRAKSSSWAGRLAKELKDPAQPAVVVSWDEAAAFAAGTGQALPTALEWEFAASWDRKHRLLYPWGDSFEQGGVELTWLALPPRVDRPSKDVSPWGIVGLGTGVREWCVDTAPDRPEHRCIRGGSAVDPRSGWIEPRQLKPELFLSTRETSALRTAKMVDVGFRCVMRLVPAGSR